MEHFFEELEKLNSLLLEMCNLVETSITHSVNAVVQRNSNPTSIVFQNESRINELEILIDQSAFHLLALQQPLAVDLRFVTMAMKINNNLERMGDIAVNIGECARSLMGMQGSMPPIDISYMAKLAQDMIRNSIDAFVRRDADLARNVLKSDDAVDSLRDDMYSEIVKFMEEDPRRVHPGIDHIFIARGLERLADHATNIAEDVLFFVQGVDVRHHAEQVY